MSGWTAPRPPAGAVGHETTRTLLALIRVHQADGRATITDVADELGRSRMATHYQLHRLEELGLAATRPRGSLRPLVRPIRPARPKRRRR